jgi:uncharacterized protein DUF4340
MKPRNLVFIALLVAALAAVSIVQKISHQRSVSSSDTSALFDISFEGETVNRIVVSRGDDEDGRVVLERLGEGWVARSAWGHPGDTRKINELLAELDGLRGEFRSKSPDVLADYGLGPDASPVLVTLYGDEWQELTSLELGGTPPNSTGVFVRDPADDAVYLCRANVLGKLGMWQGPADPQNHNFLDLMVHTCKREDITGIRLHVADQPSLVMEKTYAEPDSADGIDRSTWEWVLTEPERRPLDKSKVDTVMGALTSVQAADVADPKGAWEDYGLWKADRRVEMIMADGTEFELRFGAARPAADGKPDGVFTMGSDNTTIWVVKGFKADSIFKDLESLLPTE